MIAFAKITQIIQSTSQRQARFVRKETELKTLQFKPIIAQNFKLEIPINA